MINQVMPRATVGLVGGSDRVKILEQMQGEEAVAKYGFKIKMENDIDHPPFLPPGMISAFLRMGL